MGELSDLRHRSKRSSASRSVRLRRQLVHPRLVGLDRRRRPDQRPATRRIDPARPRPAPPPPIAGLHHDAATLFAEVIESKHKPRHAWGERAQSTFTPPADTTAVDEGSRLALPVCDRPSGHRPARSRPPPGTRIVGASSDHTRDRLGAPALARLRGCVPSGVLGTRTSGRLPEPAAGRPAVCRRPIRGTCLPGLPPIITGAAGPAGRPSAHAWRGAWGFH